MNDEGAIINVYGATIDMGDDISFVGNGVSLLLLQMSCTSERNTTVSNGSLITPRFISFLFFRLCVCVGVQ